MIQLEEPEINITIPHKASLLDLELPEITLAATFYISTLCDVLPAPTNDSNSSHLQCSLRDILTK